MTNLERKVMLRVALRVITNPNGLLMHDELSVLGFDLRPPSHVLVNTAQVAIHEALVEALHLNDLEEEV